MNPSKDWFGPKWIFHYVFYESRESKLDNIFFFKESEKDQKVGSHPFKKYYTRYGQGETSSG